MSKQSSLEGSKNPSYEGKTDIGRVTNNAQYEKYGIIEVVFLDHSAPAPVWVVGDIDRKPMTGDEVLVGYIGGRSDAPYLVGFVKNKSYTTNFIRLDEKHIILQLPVLNIGVQNGGAHNDTKTNLLDENKKDGRAFIEIKGNNVHIHHPTGAIIHHGGSSEVARKGDAVAVAYPGGTFTGTVEVEVDGVIHTGTTSITIPPQMMTGSITTGSSKTLID